MPRDFKVLGDGAFALGINHFTFHVSVHQPNDNKPGINAWYGSEFNRNSNWFEDAKSYVEYVERCSAQLQKGMRQTDIAIYIGDDVPCDNPSLPYSFPKGYDFDFVNFEVLTKLAKIENGKLLFPSGAAYRVLVLPPKTSMRPELVAKLEEFVKAGLILFGPQPIQSPSLKGFPACDSEVQTLASSVWGKIDGKTVLWNSYGLGKVCYGPNLNQFLTDAGLTPDVVMPPHFVYTHRKEAETDIYFIANQKNEADTTDHSFAVTGKQPEYWDPITGKHWDLKNYTVKNGRTFIPLEFLQSVSCFIVFRKEGAASGNNNANFPKYKEVQTIGGGWNVKFAGNVNPPFYKTFDQLTDWSLSEDQEVKYFCGRATYSVDFSFTGQLNGENYLNLGRVESLAKVYLNGKEISTLWCYPYRTDASRYLKKGSNRLEIEIINQWWNRLVGDEQPGAVRTTNLSARSFWKATDQLVPSGLLGPVLLETPIVK